MEKLIKPQNQLTLSQQLCHSFFSQKGYDPFINFHSHDGCAMYDSYLRHQRSFASGITGQNCQISFVSKFTKLE
ncbi:hypothetical protein [Methylomonas sp. YC3]